jgi:phosphoglycolate phosphatase
MIAAVVIDLDDTLCMTQATSFAMENEALGKLGLQPMSREVFLKAWGKPLSEAIAIRSPGVDVAAFRRVFALVIADYVRNGKLDVISPANFEALDALADEGRQLLVLTSRTHVELQHLLEPDHELAGRIAAFYYRDNMKFHKPDPRAFAELLGDNALSPTACVYVGDSPGDAEAANGAGLRFIASLESGLRTREDFREYRVDAFISTFPELLTAVRQLDNA